MASLADGVREVAPEDVDLRVDVAGLAMDNPVMLGLTLLLFPMMRRNMQLGWKDGVVLLLLLLLYSILLYQLPG